MNEQLTTSKSNTPIPPDDPNRKLVIARPNTDQKLSHLGLVGDTYTILLSGNDTGGRYCLIDMHIPPGGGPPPHRHDFEESFTVLEGEVAATFRGEKPMVRAGETIHIPANASHSFANISSQPARLLCICAPSGPDEFFAQVGVPLPNRTAPPPELDAAGRTSFIRKTSKLAPEYQTELPEPE